MFLWNTTYFLYMLPAFLLVMLAQFWVNSTYSKWSERRNHSGMSGGEAANRLLRHSGLTDVKLEGVSSRLGDHYDPRSKTLRLSPDVAQNPSVASLAIAAHEIGHALQHKESYVPLRFRSALVPAASIGSRLGPILIIIGLLLGGILGTQLAWVGVFAFGLGAVFALATLPLELNASSRAKALLTQSGIVRSEEERQGVSAVLNAAALTYIAALAAAILQLLYYLSLMSGGRRRR
jgi:Zn-dependent membrane protease YugP